MFFTDFNFFAFLKYSIAVRLIYFIIFANASA